MNGFPARPTLSDVAARAGVSTVTVSRVIDDSPKVASRTRARVRAAMDELGYFGNAAATQLVSGKAQAVGVIASDTAEYGYASVIAGIEQAARALDMAVLIAVIEGDGEDSARKTVATVAAHALAGVIVIDYDEPAHAVARALPSYLPSVSTTAPYHGPDLPLPHVMINEYDGAVDAGRHLIALGHRSIFILGPPSSEPTRRRVRGIEDALDEAHLPHYPVIRCADWHPEAGHAAAAEVLTRYGNEVTAIACANDEIALGAIRAIGEAGLTVPHDVSVVGCDDNPIAAYALPALTTIRQDFGRLGRQAFNLLVELAAGREAGPAEVIDATLVIRESTAAPNPRRGRWPARA
ncbi:MAG: LacI family transcriptional regulator [Bifidobacteriaceae bacterium]|nr:LacI family transcriptional regulator [Bifidobacteriaceae bacterium]